MSRRSHRSRRDNPAVHHTGVYGPPASSAYVPHTPAATFDPGLSGSARMRRPGTPGISVQPPTPDQTESSGSSGSGSGSASQSGSQSRSGSRHSQSRSYSASRSYTGSSSPLGTVFPSNSPIPSNAFVPPTDEPWRAGGSRYPPGVQQPAWFTHLDNAGLRGVSPATGPELPIFPPPVFPSSAGSMPPGGPVIPDGRPVIPHRTPVLPNQRPFISGQAPVIPGPSTPFVPPQQTPVLPNQRPFISGHAPVIPGPSTPFVPPQQTPVMPGNVPSMPTNATVMPDPALYRRPSPFSPGVRPFNGPVIPRGSTPYTSPPWIPVVSVGGSTHSSDESNMMPFYPPNMAPTPMMSGIPVLPEGQPVYPGSRPVIPRSRTPIVRPFPQAQVMPQPDFAHPTPGGRGPPVIPPNAGMPVIPGVNVPDPNAPVFGGLARMHGPQNSRAHEYLPAEMVVRPRTIAVDGSVVPSSFHRWLAMWHHPNPTATDGRINVPSLQWDIIYPPATARFYHAPAHLGSGESIEGVARSYAFQPQTEGPVHLLTTSTVLNYWMAEERWGPLVVHSAWGSITVEQLLQTVQHYFSEPLSTQEIALVHQTPGNAERIRDAYMWRLREANTIRERYPHLAHGLLAPRPEENQYLRSDVMGGHRRFYGLRHVQGEEGVRAYIEFIPGPIFVDTWLRDQRSV